MCPDDFVVRIHIFSLEYCGSLVFVRSPHPDLPSKAGVRPLHGHASFEVDWRHAGHESLPMLLPAVPIPPPRHLEEDEEDAFGLPDSIKLGLGDFIFYSVLVGRAAMYDILTVFASYLAIVAGLGMSSCPRSR